MKADAEHLPDLEGVRQHEQLGFGVSAASNGRARQPRVANFACVGNIAPVRRMALRPRPSLKIPEARRPYDGAITCAHDCKRNRCSSLSPRQGGVDVCHYRSLTAGDQTPAIKFSLLAGCFHQAVDVTVVQRFQANVLALQNKGLRQHALHYAWRDSSAATPAPADCGRDAHATAGKMPALRCRLLLGEWLDHRHFAVGNSETQPLRVSLRSAPTLRDDDCMLTPGVTCGCHSGTQKPGLQASSSKFSQRAGAAECENSVVGNH